MSNTTHTALKIGQKVRVACRDTEGNPYTQIMFVRELHNPNVAGLSYTEDSKHIIGIEYNIITPFEDESAAPVQGDAVKIYNKYAEAIEVLKIEAGRKNGKVVLEYRPDLSRRRWGKPEGWKVSIYGTAKSADSTPIESVENEDFITAVGKLIKKLNPSL